MNKYVKGNKIIEATEKAYKVIYKEQGYVPYEEEKELTIEELVTIANDKGLSSLNMVQLKRIATELGLEYDSKVKKDDLIALIEEKQGEE